MTVGFTMERQFREVPRAARSTGTAPAGHRSLVEYDASACASLRQYDLPTDTRDTK